jgi:hypothetical protein
MESEEISKTKVKLFTVGIYLLATCFFGYIAYVVISSPMTDSNDTSGKDLLYTKWIVFGLFFSFSIGCFYYVVALKTYALTNKNIIIRYPLLFYRKAIPIDCVEKMFEKDISVNMSRGLSDVAIYKGKETTVELTNGKKIKFDSLSFSNYLEFKNNISKLI